jgi:hypothetical protein
VMSHPEPRAAQRPRVSVKTARGIVIDQT